MSLLSNLGELEFSVEGPHETTNHIILNIFVFSSTLM